MINVIYSYRPTISTEKSSDIHNEELYVIVYCKTEKICISSKIKGENKIEDYYEFSEKKKKNEGSVDDFLWAF